MRNALSPDPLDQGLIQYASDLRSGLTTVEACVKSYLRRIACLNGTVRAYVQVMSESALVQARKLDELLQAGTDLGPLMGVPVAVKENIFVFGADCRGGTALDTSAFLHSEGPFIAALREAGTVILGITAMCELAMGGVGVNVFRGTPRNPWDSNVERVCGGSSSGSAAALAAGLCGFSVGTDTGGSVRSPASFLGVLGYKPTQGLWSRSGVLPLAPSFDSIGVLARSARDMSVIVSHLSDQGEAKFAGLATAPRIGVIRASIEGCTPEVERAVHRTITALEAAGFQFAEISLPSEQEIDHYYDATMRSEFLALFEELAACNDADIRNPDVAHRILLLRQAPIQSEEHLQRVKKTLEESVGAAFSRCDAIMLPTKYRIAPPLPAPGDQSALKVAATLCKGPTRLANVLDLCAISTPVVCPESGLPIGLQWLAGQGQDALLLSLAQSVEAVTGTVCLPSMHGFHLPAALSSC